MVKHILFFTLAIFLFFVHQTESKSKCLTPYGPYKPKNRNDFARYIIDIPGNPKTYTPNQRYNVSLKLNPMSRAPYSFKNFMITLESENNNPQMDGNNIVQAVGNFEFGLDMLSIFSSVCPNTVIESNALLKTEVQLYWVAPPENSGCVSIKATVIESKDSWFSEDGPLTKTLCEESSENEDTQSPVLKHCRACDEAKYELAFEGMWTRNTHPRDFPSDVWSTKFSEIIGSSHKNGHSFWRYADIASDGLKELAEEGSTRALEGELKDMSENIRTIIKAKGLQYPNITLTSYAVFRVDNQNHLVSVVSKIMPSPDWIVGVSNMELCRSDGTWEEKKVLKLYPWDVGTDEGISYTSPKAPSNPRQLIRRIKPNSPNDPRSPFYDEEGAEMKPLARIILTRQRLYEKACDENALTPDLEEEVDYTSPCATTEWSEWSPCSEPCGEGIRYKQRQYINPENAENCNKILIAQENCVGESRHCSNRHSNQEEEEEPDVSTDGVAEEERCELGDWSSWSTCSAKCGKGTKTRDRKYKHPQFANFCGSNPEDLQENDECEEMGGCEEDEEPIVDSKCLKEVTWGEWSTCSVSCGVGVKVRYRIVQSEEDDDCSSLPPEETVQCFEPSCDGGTFGDLESENHIIAQGPVGRVTHCKVSKWTKWSPCRIPNDESCGKGVMIRSRKIKVESANGGRPCPKILLKRKTCTVPCPEEEQENSRETLPSWGFPETPRRNDNQPGECIMSPWSAWSPCSTICGGSSFRQRTRYIISQPEGVVCNKRRIDQKRCPLPLACTESGKAPL